jgi:hypothetical protein
LSTAGTTAAYLHVIARRASDSSGSSGTRSTQITPPAFFDPSLAPQKSSANSSVQAKMTISHVGLPTGQKHFKEMRDFYIAVLAPLGYRVFMEVEGQLVGMAPKYGAPDFWLHSGGTEFDKFDGDVEKRGGKTHLAFQANSIKAVYDWSKVAV